MASQRKRNQRVRHEAGEENRDSPALSKQQDKKSSRSEMLKHTNNSSGRNDRSFSDKKGEITKGNKLNQTNVSVAESKDYEPVTYMEAKSKYQDTFNKRPIEDRMPLKQMEIVSNWNKFDGATLDEEIDLGEDHLIGEDFSEILRLSELCGFQGGYLHLKGESSWGDASSDVLGNLKVSELVAAFATIPFHKQLNIPEDMLPASTISHYVKLAEEKKKSYKADDTTTPVDDINRKIIDSLTFKDPLSLINDDEEDSIHPRIREANKSKATKKFTVVTGTKEMKNDSKTVQQSFDFSITKSKDSDQVTPREDTGLKSCRSDLDVTNSSTALKSALSEKKPAGFTVPPSLNNNKQIIKAQPLNATPQVPSNVDAQLEDWLDSMLDD